MRLVRFLRNGVISRGILEGETIWVVDEWPGEDQLSWKFELEVPAEEATLLAPVEPRKIVGIGRNYAEHARELGNEVPENPLMFLKPGTAVIGPEDVIRLPKLSSRVDYEGELAVVIGRRAKDVGRDEWRSYVLGFTCANDVTARDIQKKDVQFTRGKGFDTFCPIGPWIETDLDVGDLSIETTVNGETVQSGRTAEMIFDIGALIERITEVMTLEPLDVILTGTPEGVGPLDSGDSVNVTIEGIGTLSNSVA